MSQASVRIEPRLAPEDQRLALDRLIAFNAAAAGPLAHRELFVSLRQDEALRGACIGRTYWGWLFVDILWIADEFRGQGYGKTLIGMAEDEARSRGCRHAYLDTFSFQAPDFYRRLGYAEFGRLPDFPEGHSRHFLTKAL